MRLFREPEESDFGKNALTFALGAVGGLAIGMLLARRPTPARVGRLGTELRERARMAGDRARTVARRLQPARLRRMAGEQSDLNDLEDRVIDAFLADEVLSERGIDVGAISPGIVELSGSVWTEDEAHRAVRVANGLPGVNTVVNRMDVEDEVRHLELARRRLSEDVSGLDSLQHGQARTGGMGKRRQGHQTDPDQPNDSQLQELEALESADVGQWEDEGFAHANPRTTLRSDMDTPNRTKFDEDELDNQDPHGKNAAFTLDEQPQESNSAARVGEGMKPGTRLRLEQKGIPDQSGKGSDEKS